MTVEQFFVLGDEPINKIRGVNWKEIRKTALEILRKEGLSYAPDTKLKELSVSDIQMIEILRRFPCMNQTSSSWMNRHLP